MVEPRSWESIAVIQGRITGGNDRHERKWLCLEKKINRNLLTIWMLSKKKRERERTTPGILAQVPRWMGGFSRVLRRNRGGVGSQKNDKGIGHSEEDSSLKEFRKLLETHNLVGEEGHVEVDNDLSVRSAIIGVSTVTDQMKICLI
jgi:hypothetical protein